MRKKSVDDLRKELLYGAVEITGGKHKGLIGYYDDDDWGSDRAVVYLDIPFLTDYVLIPMKYLKNTEAKHLPTEALKKKNPAGCRLLGL